MAKLAYILSASHSGSTLLAMLLGAHPDACTVGELKATSLGDAHRYLCSCGTPIRACQFWKSVTDRMAQRGIAFDVAHAGTSVHAVDSRYARRLLRPLHRGPILETVRDVALAFSPSWRFHLATSQIVNANLVQTLTELTGAKIVIDSSKVAIRLKYLLQNPDLDIRVIRLIRDGRGVTLTYVNPIDFADADDPSRRSGGYGGDRDSEKLSMADAALEWRRSNEEAEQLLNRVDPSHQTKIHYEDLCADPEAVLITIFEFLEIDPARMVREFRSVDHHVVGNGMRLNTTSAIRLDERWKTNLSDDQLRIFDAVAGALNRKYGYVE
jgi:hypothetical protein